MGSSRGVVDRLPGHFTRGATVGFDAWISSLFSVIKLPAVVYLWERINFLNRVQFYSMEERMNLGKILFHSVIL